MLEMTNRKQDLTSRAVNQQLTALGCKLFDIGVRDAHTSTMRNFEGLSKTEVVKRIDWLKSENIKGKHIYMRPSQTGVVLVDDLSQSTLERMNKERVRPALVVETSPQNYQAWIRLSHEPISPELATQAAKLLAKRYGGDEASAGFKHYGRLAGFTNTKPKHVSETGRFPFVKVGARSGSIAERAPEILGAAHRELLKAAESLQERFKLKDTQTYTVGEESRAIAQYELLRAPIESRYSPSVNYSKLDWMVAKQMLISGFKPDSIVSAIVSCSKNLEERKGKYMQDYAERTVNKAASELVGE